MAFPDSRTMPWTVFFPTRKKPPKDANDFPVARYLKQIFFLRLPEMLGQVTQLKTQLYEGKKKIKRKNVRKWGYSEKEMAILCHEFYGVLFAA